MVNLCWTNGIPPLCGSWIAFNTVNSMIFYPFIIFQFISKLDSWTCSPVSTDLKLRQSFVESRRHENGQSTDICRYTNSQQEAPEQQPQQHKPSLEETVDGLLKRLREKRQALGLPDNMKVRPSVDAFCSGGWGFDCVLVRPGFAVINSTRTLLSTGDDPKTDGPGEDHSAKMSAVFWKLARPSCKRFFHI